MRRLTSSLLLCATLFLPNSNLHVVQGAHSGDYDNATQESKNRARELWEQMIIAKGGRERLRSVTSLFIAAELGKGFREYTLLVFPDHRFNYSYWADRERTDIDISNGRTGITWWQVEGSKARPRSYGEDDAYLTLLPQLLYLLETHDMNPVPLRARKASIGLRKVDVIEVSANGWRVDYYLDPKTHLPTKAVLPNGPKSRAIGQMNQEVKLFDYKEIDGVMMPHRVSYAFTTNQTERSDHLAFEINPAYDAKIFDQPPTAKTGPEAWRAKR
jgi:hypothetical protein